MKKLMISLLALGSVASVFAQDVVLKKTKVSTDKLPNVVIGSVTEQTPQIVYKEFDAVPTEQVNNAFVLKNTGDLDDYDTYQVTLVGKHKKIVETYDNKGNLIDIREFSKNERIPDDIALSIVNAYPGWAISKDVYRMNRLANGREDESYRVTLEKGNKKMNIYLDASGGILNEPLKNVETM